MNQLLFTLYLLLLHNSNLVSHIWLPRRNNTIYEETVRSVWMEMDEEKEREVDGVRRGGSTEKGANAISH